MQIIQRLGDLWVGRAKASRTRRTANTAANATPRPAVVITGGSRGIGRAIAAEFLCAGHDVVLVARGADGLKQARSILVDPHHGAEITATVDTLPLDITGADAAGELASELSRLGVYCDVLVNAAGIGQSGPFTNADQAALDNVVALNIAGLTRLTRTVLPDMLARGEGGILNMASLGAAVPGPNQAAYYASKAYVMSLSEAIAAETSGQGVRVCVCLPGPVETGFHRAMGSESALYRRLLPQLSAERTARIAVRGFRLGRRVVVPGLFNSALFITLKLLPRAVTVPITGWLLRNRAT